MYSSCRAMSSCNSLLVGLLAEQSLHHQSMLLTQRQQPYIIYLQDVIQTALLGRAKLCPAVGKLRIM
jgi:hypothetical protein